MTSTRDLLPAADPVIRNDVPFEAVPPDGAGIAYGDTFRLHSDPASTLRVFLDFDGHTTVGTPWNDFWNTGSIASPAFSLDAGEDFSSFELVAIQQIWQYVAETFAPFNIDVTTEDPGTAGLNHDGDGDDAYGIRVVVTDEAGRDHGGIAYVGSFNWNSGTPAFVYADRLSDNAKYIANAAAHEVGHALGLSHDGRGNAEYDYGHGVGATSWAPVMGAGYFASIVQFSNGAYHGANQTQDDLAIITSANGDVGYRADDHGAGPDTATPLPGAAAGSLTDVAAYGVIAGSGARNDVDMFVLEVAPGGAIDLGISAWSQAWVSGQAGPVHAPLQFTALDIKAVLHDAAMQAILVDDDPTRTDATIRISDLAGGTYYLAIDGTGFGDPFSAAASGYTEYGSLGQYMIRGTYDGMSGGAGSGPDSLVLDVSGDAYLGDARFTVSVDGVQVGAVFSARASRAAGEAEPIVLRGDWAPGEHVVAVSFVNDLFDGAPDSDRNLYVESITYNDAVVPQGSAALYTAGTREFRFTDDPVPSPTDARTTDLGSGPDTIELGITQDAYLGDALYSLDVDGVSLGHLLAAKALHGSGAMDTVRLHGDWDAGPHTVTVAFLNDAYEGAADRDRNLYVEHVIYNGVDVPGGAATLYAAGAQDVVFVGS